MTKVCRTWCSFGRYNHAVRPGNPNACADGTLCVPSKGSDVVVVVVVVAAVVDDVVVVVDVVVLLLSILLLDFGVAFVAVCCVLFAPPGPRSKCEHP